MRIKETVTVAVMIANGCLWPNSACRQIQISMIGTSAYRR